MINNNRQQNGRRRGRGGQRQGGGQGGRDNGSRIDNRSRGNAAQLLEKYKSLAADAQRQGDRVNTEYYLQFADHYFRVVSEQRGRFEEQNQQPPRRQQAEGFDDGYDSDEEYGYEGERVRADQYQPRGDEQQQGREDRGERRARNGDDQRGDRSRDNGRRDRPARYDSDEGTRSQPAMTPHDPATAMASTERGADEDVAPRRRGRSPRTLSEVQEPATHDIDRLPPSFAPANDGGDETAAVDKPRRRRLRPTGEASQAN